MLCGAAMLGRWLCLPLWLCARGDDDEPMLLATSLRVLAWGGGGGKEEDKLSGTIKPRVFPPHTHCTPRVSCCISVLCLCPECIE